MSSSNTNTDVENHDSNSVSSNQNSSTSIKEEIAFSDIKEEIQDLCECKSFGNSSEHLCGLESNTIYPASTITSGEDCSIDTTQTQQFNFSDIQSSNIFGVCPPPFSTQELNLETYSQVFKSENSINIKQASETKSFDLAQKTQTHPENINKSLFKSESFSDSFSSLNQCEIHFKVQKRKYVRKKPIKPITCGLCSATFTRVSSLNVHIRIHEGEKVYKCKLCSESFSSRHTLHKHHSVTHTDMEKKLYPCNICSATFYLTQDLKKHLRTHTGEKPYSCQICSASFSQSSNMKSHMRTHFGEKPFKCDTCMACFSEKSNLRKHMMTHTGEKPYSCETCSTSFASKGNLNEHRKIHTGERPFKCDICSIFFQSASHLKRHTKIHLRKAIENDKVVKVLHAHGFNI